MAAQRETEGSKANIVMWGAPTCGKTTFLAALSIALGRQSEGWKVIGANDQSTRALVTLTTQLSDGVFPKASGAVIEHYRWRLVGQELRRGGWKSLFRRSPVGVQFGLDLADLGGEGYSPRRLTQKELIDDLVNSRGIVFLFDPVREFEKGDAFEYLFGVLSHLSQHFLENPEFSSGLLPHHLAICITKFDELRVLETAEKLGLTQPDEEEHFPRVDDGDDARELFEKLCEVSASGYGGMILNTLEQYFAPERTRYFVTSAIGFHVDPRLGYDPDDHQNVMTDEKGFTRIRGTVRPVNVMEPLLWLGRRLGKK
ncbi:hypothetical protein [Actinocorallia libanotica]|uniref:Uncharacterized protein n=1 Tax=Actinocorallia libanotica TaxID=46162 RepID=A0ABN1QUT0_9ACTN